VARFYQEAIDRGTAVVTVEHHDIGNRRSWDRRAISSKAIRSLAM